MYHQTLWLHSAFSRSFLARECESGAARSSVGAAAAGCVCESESVSQELVSHSAWLKSRPIRWLTSRPYSKYYCSTHTHTHTYLCAESHIESKHVQHLSMHVHTRRSGTGVFLGYMIPQYFPFSSNHSLLCEQVITIWTLMIMNHSSDCVCV